MGFIAPFEAGGSFGFAVWSEAAYRWVDAVLVSLAVLEAEVALVDVWADHAL